MLNALQQQPADKILTLMQAYANDPRCDKIDLGVGVYKDADGHTPIMRAVKAAEQMLWQDETTKSYVALAGDPAFSEAMRGLVLGDAVPVERVAAAATPGGTGALRVAFELVQMANPGLRVYVSDPTWPNHLGILNRLKIETRPYRYFDAESRAVDFAGMMADLEALRAGDVVLLHGCCHNPTGANLTLPEWQAVVDLVNRKGAIPLIDVAYQGFGDGLQEDAAGTRLVAAGCPEVVIAASCSKNFGIYRERTGLVMAVSDSAQARAVAQDTLTYIGRLIYSFPPDHGARLVTLVLQDEALRADWQDELDAVRRGMLEVREALAGELQRLSGSDRFGFLAQHRGMFSRLGASPAQVERLRSEYGIYMIGDSRMNIAGLTRETVPVLAQAIIETGI